MIRHFKKSSATPTHARQRFSEKWQLRTPAMAACVTDHIWRMEELLLLRIPPWRQDAMLAA